MAAGNRSARLVLCLLVAALVASSACGARWSDKQRTALLARSRSSAAAAAAQTDTGTGSSSDALTSGDTSSGSTGGVGGRTATTVRGGAKAAASSRPCAAASTAPGVTASTITIGSISTNSGPVPGLGATSIGAARAYIAMRNATGGICGRQLLLKTADDGFDNSRYREIISGMDPQVLGLASGLGAGDAGGVDIVASKRIPAVVTAVSDAFQNSSTVFDINPPFANEHAVGGKFKWLYDHGVRTAALVYLSNPGVKSQVQTQRNLMEAVGIKVVSDQELPLSTLSYDAAAREVANSKADYLFFPAAGNINASMAKSMYDTGYKLKFGEYLTAYGSDFIDLAGPAAEDVVSFSRALPSESNDGNAEQKRFVDWMNRVVPGVTPDYFAADAWASAKAFFDNLDALPGPITRDALIKQLKSVKTYDGDGFFGPIQLGAKLSNGCVIGMQVKNQKWVRFVPDHGFLC